MSKSIINKIIIFHSVSIDSLRWVKEKCFEKFEFSTTSSDICTNADDVEMIKSKALIIFKLFKLGIAVLFAEWTEGFADLIAWMRFEQFVSFKLFFVFEFQTLEWLWNSMKMKWKLCVLIIIKIIKKKNKQIKLSKRKNCKMKEKNKQKKLHVELKIILLTIIFIIYFFHHCSAMKFYLIIILSCHYHQMCVMIITIFFFCW